MTLSLRPARATDAGRVGGILSEFIDGTDWMPRLHTRAEDIGFAGKMIERGWVTVAERDDQIEGFLACENMEVHALYVAETSRKIGIGSVLLNNEMQRRPALSLWTFQCNRPARRFYAIHGFSEVQFDDGSRNDEGLPDVMLKWERDVS